MTKSTLIISKDGDLEWRNEKRQFHRGNDKPAIIRPNGHKAWYVNGLRHRDNDKPAVIWSNGIKEWYVNGKRHRDNDKPAVIYSDGTKYWYVNGEFIKSSYD